MNTSTELSPKAATALRSIRAIRKLPESSGTTAAERRVLNNLNSVDTLAVALALDDAPENDTPENYASMSDFYDAQENHYQDKLRKAGL